MKRSLPAIAAALALFSAASVAFAGDDVTSLSYISYLERYATLQPAQTGETLDVVVNMPVLTGDRLSTSRGARVEVQLADGSTVWVDEFSTMDFDALAFSRDDSSARSTLYLAEGTAAVEIPAIAAGDGTLRLDSPAGTVYLNRPGLYRLALRGNEIRVQAFSGLAELPAGVGSALLRGGEEATVTASGEIQKAGISDRTDDFWNWVQERRNPSPSGRTAQYVDTRAAGRAAVLDSYGDWVYVNTFSSWMWQPRVNVTWAPYSYGRWYWTPVGWNWISYEPWGWYPFHYGSWYLDASFGWVWGWDSMWSPAWVHWLYTPGYVGWCPRGYYDWWYYHNCSNCWGDKWMHPGRWTEVAFNFSGRVRLADVDPRPWTIVPEGQFGNTHLERVRLEPNRLMRDLPGDRTGVVRTGPMVTTPPSRGLPERGVESFFRLGAKEREVPDLSRVLRRESVTSPRVALGNPNLQPLRTGDFGAGPRVQVSGPPTRSGSSGVTERWHRVGLEDPPARGGSRPVVQRTQGNPGASNPPRDSVRPPSRNVEPNRGSAPPPEPPQAPPPEPPQAPPPERPQVQPAERPPAQAGERTKARSESLARTRERLWNRVQAERQASSGRSTTSIPWREIPVRSQPAEPRYQPRNVEAPRAVARRALPVRSQSAEPRYQPRSVEAPREAQRSASVSQAPAAVVRSAPSSVSHSARSSVSHSAPAPRAVSSGGSSSRAAAPHASSGSGRPHND
jgi:hypothetical protein